MTDLTAAQWFVLGSVVLAGIIVGGALRVVTAGVIGANIGAGLVLLFAVPAVLGLVGFAMIRSGQLVRRGRAQPR